MSPNASDNTRFERLIAEAFAAQKAGVFAQTPVDVAELAAAPQPSRRVPSRWAYFHERMLVGLPVAACVAVIIGMASLWSLETGDSSLSSPLASLSPASGLGSALAAEPFNARVIVDCLSGPGTAVSDRCRAADFDDDGDVDLLDLSAYQREAAGVNR